MLGRSSTNISLKQTVNGNNIQLFHEAKQIIVIYQWRADQLFVDAKGKQIIDLRVSDKSPSSIIVLSFTD